MEYLVETGAEVCILGHINPSSTCSCHPGSAGWGRPVELTGTILGLVLAATKLVRISLLKNSDAGMYIEYIHTTGISLQ